MCSAKCRDKLLVEADIFTILGASFCATRLPSIQSKLKNKNIVAHLRKPSMQLFCTVLTYTELFVIFESHTFFSLRQIHYHL